MKVITICGSMKFQEKMIEVARELELNQGYCVIQCVYNLDQENTPKKQLEKVIDAHWKKIDLSDAIFVVNVGGYIGSSCKKEIEYALNQGKEVIYLEN